MEQRCEPRFKVDQSIVITILEDPEVRLTGRIRDASGRGLLIEVPREVLPGTALKIEVDDSLLLGEAIHCKRSFGLCLLGLEFDQVLCGLAELDKQLQKFSDEDSEGVAYKYNAHRFHSA
jgi:hypothetical protein